MPQVFQEAKPAMAIAVSPLVSHVEAAPIAEALSWIRSGERNRPFLNLCQAVPSYPPADELQRAIGEFAHETETSLYTDIRGLPVLREALALHMSADYRGSVDASQVTITAGCNQAFCATLMAIASRGDNVIMPSPWYFNHRMWLDMLGVEARAIPTFAAGRNCPSAADAAARIDDKTRAIILCTPNNPSGAIYPPDEIRAFFDIARMAGIALIIDETYKDFREGHAPAHGLFAAGDWDRTFIQLYSFSKVFALTGYRAGSIIAGGQLQAEIEKVLDCIAICTPTISQKAALFGLQHLDSWKAEKRRLTDERRAALLDAFQNPALRYELVSSGAYFAYVKHPFAERSSRDVAKWLAQEHDLLCLPGSVFGPGQENYLRLAFANAPIAHMPLVVERLIGSQRAK
jgi:aspartate/methionine/tyrosine aminotransferase